MKYFLAGCYGLLNTANVFPSSPILVNLMTKVIGAIENSVLTATSLRSIPEGVILHNPDSLGLKFLNSPQHC
jgi:hypothetical protein